MNSSLKFWKNQFARTTVVSGWAASTACSARSGRPRFDWDDRSTWAAALDGVDAVYIAYFPDLAVPGASEVVGALAEQATAAGARRIVLLSGRGEEEAERAEQVLIGSGADWTIVRCSWFNQNFSEDYLRDSVLAGEVTLPVSDVPEPFVDAEDIADVAVAALTEDGHCLLYTSDAADEL